MVTALTGAVSSPDLLTVTRQLLIKRTVNSLLGEGAVHVLMFVRWEGLSPSQRLSSQKPRGEKRKPNKRLFGSLNHSCLNLLFREISTQAQEGYLQLSLWFPHSLLLCDYLDVDGGNDSGRGHSLCARVSKCCLVVLGPYWDNVLNQNLDLLESDSDEVSLLPIRRIPS